MYQLIDLSQEYPLLTLQQAMDKHRDNRKTFDQKPIREGVISRQAVDGTWKDRRLILHTHSVLFLNPWNGQAIDCVPTYQIIDVSRFESLDCETSSCVAITYMPSRKPPTSKKEFEKIREESQHYETRTFYCRIPERDASEWVKAIDSVAGRFVEASLFEKVQRRALQTETAPIFQILMAVAIMANFIVLCVEAQVMPAEDSEAARALLSADYVFTAWCLPPVL